MKYMDVKYEVNDLYNNDLAKEIKLGVKFETSLLVSNLDSIQSINPIEDAIYKVKRSMVEEVFGEFRPIIYDLYHAIYQKDMWNAKNLLENLEKRMFEV